MSLKDLIAGARDINLTPVEVPEWGTTVFIRQLNVQQRHQLHKAVGEKDAEARLSVYVLLNTLADADGTLVFGPDHYDLLASKNAAVMDRVARGGLPGKQPTRGGRRRRKKRLRADPELSCLYTLCHEYGYTPDQVRKFDSRDFVFLIANIHKGGSKKLDWDKGGQGVVLAWANALRKAKDGRK